MNLTAAIPALLERTAATLAARRRFPCATYRLQFNAGFTFRDAEALVDYFDDLGITDCYASPYLQARPGSLHGYDISDHRHLNPEIGTEEDYAAWMAALKQRGMGQLLDVVPNHAGIGGNDNAWWNDVLENGPASPYAGYFDIDWNSLKPDLNNKVLLPILGDPYGQALEALQLRLVFEAGAFTIHYFDHYFPVSPCTYGKILRFRQEELERELGKDSHAYVEYQSILTAITHLPPRDVTDPNKQSERQREKEVIKRRLAALVLASSPVLAFIERNVTLFNGHEGDPHSFDLLDDLLGAQAYRLSSWRVACDEINYRRFFDVNELAALSMEKPEVFEATHELILRLLREGHVTGLRVDHPDGLYDPRQYLERLQYRYAQEVARRIAATDPDFQGLDGNELDAKLTEALERIFTPLAPLPQGARGAIKDRPLYVVVEKILGPDEPLPEDWPVYGTTGYEFLRVLNNLFVEKDNAAAFTRLYRRWTGLTPSFPEIVYRKKFLTLQVSLSSELQVLANQLDRLSEKDRWSRDFTLIGLRRALREIIACFEVYRSYINGRGIQPRDRLFVERAVARAKRRNPAISGALFDFVRDVLLLKFHEAAPPEAREELRRFVGKFQQLTAPVMAKGVEDTAFYVYNRLLSLNEVGGDPGQFGMGLPSFHRSQQERRARFPHALSATATHDTKRGEDVRARLNVLSEMPQAWRKALARWRRLNARCRVRLDDEIAPDRNEEYFIYQTLVGAWPLPPHGPEEHGAFVDRIQAYLQKALHEAKTHTSWINPDPAYDGAVAKFVERILDERQSARFLEDFRAFQANVRHYGLFNSLSQALLKVTLPGIPDFYQGTELWDFSLVDPDNRRPVDYDLRRRTLAELRATMEERRTRGFDLRVDLSRITGESAVLSRPQRARAEAARAELGRESRPPKPNGLALKEPDNAMSDLSRFARELTAAKEDGRIKLYLLTTALHCRRDRPELFAAGDYLPAHASGERANVCAFVRRQGGERALVAVPRLLTRLVEPGELPLGPAVWGDEVLYVPGVEPGERLRNVFTGEVLTAGERDRQTALPLAEVFGHFPAALFLVASVPD
jgi:(1->4)-alpha-D-glucan 1-alpha-D-glucosylmutase